MTTDNGQLTADGLSLIERAERGIVPADLGTCTMLLRVCARLDRATLAVRWMAIAAARDCPEFAGRDDGRTGKPSPWLEWVMAEYEDYGNKSHIHHMARVGEFLLRALRAGLRVCGDHTPYELPFDSLLALSRLPDHLLGPVMAKYDLAAMDRGTVRRLVAQCLKSSGLPADGLGEDADGGGRKRAGNGGGRVQGDFLDVLFGMVGQTIDDTQHRALVDSDRVRPLNAAINGLDLVKVAAEKWARAQKVDETELEETIDELDSLRAMLVERLAGAAGIPALEA